MATAKKKESKPDEKSDQVQLEELRPDESDQYREPRQWTLGKDDQARVYTQKPLSYFRKMQLFALVGGVVRQAMVAGGEGSLGDVLGLGQMSGPNRGSVLSSIDFRDAESFISLASSVAAYVPGFMENAYCILLAIPVDERDWARDMMQESHEDGGFSDEDGVEVLQVFVAQNWGAIQAFFFEHLPKILVTARETSAREKKKEEEDSDDE